jgi:hypothetical protein
MTQTNNKVTITGCRLRQYQAAENVARSFRRLITSPASDLQQIATNQNSAIQWLLHWLTFSQREFSKPPIVPSAPKGRGR